MGDEERERPAGETGQITLAAVVEADEGYDAEGVGELTRRLRSELLDLDIEAVDPAPSDEAPAGAKGMELLGSGGLGGGFLVRADGLKSVAPAAAAWVGRQRARSVKLTLDGDVLEVTGLSSAE